MLSNIPYEEMPEKIEELAGDVERLENNWNELKEHIKNEMFIQDKLGSYAFVKFYSDLLDKMQEIESEK